MKTLRKFSGRLLALLILAIFAASGCSRLADSPARAENSKSPATKAKHQLKSSSSKNWPLYRGNPLANGVSESDLPQKLTLKWKFPVKEGAFEATAAIVDSTVYIGDLDGKLYALDLQTGEKRWELKIDSGFIASPAVRDGRIYVGDYDGRFYCVDAAKGKLIWDFETQAEIDSGANFYQENILVGSQDATLYCLSADKGELVWKHTIDDQIRCMPTIVENRAFLGGCDGKLHIIDLDKGEEIGAVNLADASGAQDHIGTTPAVQGDFVYFGTEGGTFFCINWKEAKIRWSYSDPRRSQAFRSSAAVFGDRAIVGGRNKRVEAFHTKTGEPLWSFPTRRRVDSSPVIVGERVFVGSSDGRLYALDLNNGKELWSYEAGGGFISSPAVAQGRLVIASDDGIVYCFGE